MYVREAHDGDLDAVAALTGMERDACARLLRERSVTVAVPGDEPDAAEPDGDDEEETAEPVGCVAFDTWRGAVHVTRVAGEKDAMRLLLAEPVRFAEAEGMPVEVVVPADDTATAAAVEDAGFAAVGDGPLFAGDPTRRYRRT